MIDLTTQAGFPLLLNPGTLEIVTPGDIQFIQETRRMLEMRAIVREPEALPAGTALYWNYKLKDAGRAEPEFEALGLTFGLVCLPPLKIGREYVKTHGHYHSAMPGSQIAFPEVYTHYYGQLYLYMQRRQRGSASQLDDCVLYRMKPGHSITIPPGYAHILINPSTGPTLMAGLYAQDAIHDYHPIREMAGAAYYFIEEDGHVGTIPNLRYTGCPPLREIETLTVTHFAPPDSNRPLWSSFVEDPRRYAFITDPNLAGLQFLLEDQAR